MPIRPTDERPLHVAVVGSGPSGFYAAEGLQRAGVATHIDMFECLPTPYGLVRGGVAPDHPKIRNVMRIYEAIARRPGFRFLGNVRVGRDLAVHEMRPHYDAIILCTGAETSRRLHIPGEELPGSHAAADFVGWYNGHPDHRHHVFDLSREVAVVVGQGNVAADVCRMLLKTPDELAPTEIVTHAFEALAESRVREVHLIGRRGPAQARFTAGEIREFGRLADCDASLDPNFLKHGPACRREIDASTEVRKLVDQLEAFAYAPPAGKSRRLRIGFYESPIRLGGDDAVREVVLERNRMEGPAGHQRAMGTGETRTLPCGLFLRSIGFRGLPIPGVPFDAARGVLPHAAGRVLEGTRPVPGLYTAGWLKRGPSGTIGTNRADSAETVTSLLADLPQLTPCPYPGPAYVDSLLAARAVRVVDFEAWKRIDAAEVRRGEDRGKPRERAVTRDELLRLAAGGE